MMCSIVTIEGPAEEIRDHKGIRTLRTKTPRLLRARRRVKGVMRTRKMRTT